MVQVFIFAPLKRSFRALAYSIMVVRQILVLFVLVRIQVGQPYRTDRFFAGLSFFIFAETRFQANASYLPREIKIYLILTRKQNYNMQYTFINGLADFL